MADPNTALKPTGLAHTIAAREAWFAGILSKCERGIPANDEEVAHVAAVLRASAMLAGAGA